MTQSDEKWRQQLTAGEFRVCRQKGTERPFSGAYWDSWQTGNYLCKCCGERLFSSEHKFDAGCGWPSFSATASDGVVAEQRDVSLGMARTEILCSSCGSHLGHVFQDGPQPTGLRYCVNSLSVNFDAADTKPASGA